MLINGDKEMRESAEVMSDYYLAVDLGASGGRHIVGRIEDGKLRIDEIYRFSNGPKRDGANLVWDVDGIFAEILSGMKECKRRGIVPVSVGVDSWGVDYVLLDSDMQRVGRSYSYRDRRTEGMDGRFDAVMPPDELYGRTGIQRMIINTIYQLTAHMQNEPGDFGRAERLLMIPDYFHFLFAGELCSEYTNATTTQLVNAVTKNWDAALIKAAGIPETIFGELQLPGSCLGKLRKGIADEVGFECDVVLPPTHDTASAVAALPISGSPEKAVWLSSGTWSLMGGETDEPFITDISRKLNFTNEGGYGGKYCLLKNIMGLWMLQSVRRELAPEMSYDDVALASERAGTDTLVDCEDSKFLSPDSMTGAIVEYCKERGMRAPSGIAETAAVIYGSLAASYAENLSELREITGVEYTDFHILGGGSKDDYLNRLTARMTGMAVHAGPGEASAIGNIIVQMISDGVFADIAEARNCVRESFGIRSYEGGNGGG